MWPPIRSGGIWLKLRLPKGVPKRTLCVEQDPEAGSCWEVLNEACTPPAPQNADIAPPWLNNVSPSQGKVRNVLPHVQNISVNIFGCPPSFYLTLDRQKYTKVRKVRKCTTDSLLAQGVRPLKCRQIQDTSLSYVYTRCKRLPVNSCSMRGGAERTAP